MKLSEIEVGKTYRVRIPKDVDEYLHFMGGSPPKGLGRIDIDAEVLEKDVERTVLRRHSLGGIVGSPRVVSGSHTASGGIKIRFTDPGSRSVVREEIVPSAAIKWEVRAS
jgi:hypothetical protein